MKVAADEDWRRRLAADAGTRGAMPRDGKGKPNLRARRDHTASLDDLAAWGVPADVWAAAWRDAEPLRKRDGSPYKPSLIRSYEAAAKAYLLPAVGGKRVGEVTRRDVQALANRLTSRGLAGSTVRNAVAPLGLLFRLAERDGLVSENPLRGVVLPVANGRRERVAELDEASGLLAALTAEDRARWALAFYAGMRIGEIRALRWRHVDLAAGEVHVRDALDGRGETIPPKSKAGRRRIPILEPLREVLIAHKLATWSDPDGYVVGKSQSEPFTYTPMLRRARAAWKRAGLEGIRPHEARHTFASWLIEAEVQPYDLSRVLGHSNLATTMGIYVHELRRANDQLTARANAYLARADTESRLRQIDGDAA